MSGLTVDELREHAIALRTVLRVADAVHLSTDFADLAERTVDAIIAYTRYPSVGLFKIDHVAGYAELVAVRGFGPKVNEAARRLPLVSSLTGVAVRSRAVTTTADLALDNRVELKTRSALEAEGFIAVACVPIFFREEVIGCLNLIYKHAANLSDHERSTLTTIGKTIGIAMQNRIASEERRVLEERLRRQQQLESLGTLAAGIAHDFNNLLVSVLGNISRARDQLSSPDELAAILAETEQGALQAAALARQLLTLARGGAPHKRSTSHVATIVRDAAQLAVRGGTVRCQVEVKGEIGQALVDPVQLAQVVQNLVLNAAQASHQGGSVQVTVERCERVTAPALRLTVRDRGCGIPRDALDRIFEPYFTTRHAGNGLGLAITHSIVLRHGGHIDVESEPGIGSTFRVELPLHSDAEAETQPTATAARPQKGTRVLLVDDDAGVRRTVMGMLGRLQVEAVAVGSSTAAVAELTRALREGRRFDGAIVDLTMVGSDDGVSTLRRLKQLDPQLRAVVSSGYSDDGASRDFAQHGFVGSLPKPYTLQQLSAAIAQLCHADATGANAR